MEFWDAGENHGTVGCWVSPDRRVGTKREEMDRGYLRSVSCQCRTFPVMCVVEDVFARSSFPQHCVKTLLSIPSHKMAIFKFSRSEQNQNQKHVPLLVASIQTVQLAIAINFSGNDTSSSC